MVPHDIMYVCDRVKRAYVLYIHPRIRSMRTVETYVYPLWALTQAMCLHKIMTQIKAPEIECQER